jgi:3D (Asp-Asp-Asp) domain-containing protein
MTVRTTAYTANEPNGGGSYSAMGNRLRYGGNLYSAASDWSWLPMGTVFRMKSNGRTYVIDDYGSALVGRQTIDLYTPNSRVMNSWGVRHMDIEIIKLGSYDRSLSLLESRQAGARYVRRMVAALRQRQAGAIAVLLAGGGASSGPLAP